MEYAFLNTKEKAGCHQFRFPHSHSRGFTLIEMLVSIALFSLVMLATASVLLSVVDANHKAQGLKTSINNLSLAMDSMTRNLRTGNNYDSSGFAGGACQSTGKTGVAFVDHGGLPTQYRLRGGAIEISKDGGISFSAMTAPEITVDRLCFYVSGNVPNDLIQPRIFITVGGAVNNLTAAGAKSRTLSRFDIQTFVSQRALDVPAI